MPTQPLGFPVGDAESYSRGPDTRTGKESPDGGEAKSLLMQSDGERSGRRKTKGPRTYQRNRPKKTSQKNAGELKMVRIYLAIYMVSF